MAKAFATYGFDLKDPNTDVMLNIPASFKATYNYKLNSSVYQGVFNLEEATDSLLRQS
jgi:hypothetical protein